MIGGMISSIKKATTKKPGRNGNSRYANFDFEDASGIVRCIIWPDDFAKYEDMMKPEMICLLQGRIDRRGREPNVIVNRLMTLDQADREFTTQVAIKFQRGLHTEQDMQRVRSIINRHPGETDVVLVIDSFEDNPAEAGADEPAGPDTTNGDSATALATAVRPRNRVRYIMTTGNDSRVSCNPDFRRELADVLGSEDVQLMSSTKKATSSG